MTNAPSAAEMIARAQALAPALAERAGPCEKLRRLPDETVADLVAAGFHRVLQPARFGGLQMSWDTQCEISAALARACASTSWVACVWAAHNHLVGCLPNEAQEEAWGNDPDALVSSGLIPSGKAAPAKGGYVLSGRWGFSSGIDHAGWLVAGGFLHDPAQDAPRQMFFLVPRDAATVVDDWHVTGMAGTGSKSFVLDELFVPPHRAIGYRDATEGVCPGQASPPALYRTPRLAAAGLALAAVSLGAAEGMLADFAAACLARTRARARRAAGDAVTALLLAEVGAELDAARLMLMRSAAEVADLIARDAPATPERRLVWKRDSSYVARAVGQSAQRLFAAAGGTSIFESSRLQRAFRDVHAGAQHITLAWELNGLAFGQHQLGYEPDPSWF
jgi:alkylation response protein AidB-like acyl-CoA dehydrogenase